MSITELVLLVGGTLGVGVVSALLPLVPIEVYVLGVAATTTGPWALIAGAAALGQAVGKCLIFTASRRAGSSPAVAGRWQRWTARRRAAAQREVVGDGPIVHRSNPLTALSRRMWDGLRRSRISALGVLAASAVAGIPPLLATSVLAAATRIRLLEFAGVCLIGRFLRFTAVVLAPDLVR